MAEALTTPDAAAFATRRLRRLRRTPALRRLVAEARLGVDDLVAPLFVREGTKEPTPIASMPGEVQHTVDSVVVEAKRLVSLGLPGLILFGVPARKDAQGSGAWNPEGVVQVALRAVRDAVGDELVLMADLCLDEYTDHGHCGVLSAVGRGAQRPDARALPAHRAGAGRSRGRRRRAERDDGRPGGGHPRRAGRGGPRSRSPSWPTPPSTPPPSTGPSGTRSTSPSPGVATAGATSRTRATGARRWPRSPSTCVRAPT